jgi:predicted RNase H-like HicB family nuclease
MLGRGFDTRKVKGSMTDYPVILLKSDEGCSASCPVLPGCWSQGAAEEEALANIRAAIREYVEDAEEFRKLP